LGNKVDLAGFWLAVILLMGVGCTYQQSSTPAETEALPSLSETIISVTTPSGAMQTGVLSMRGDASEARYLAVIIPGHPGILRPTNGPNGAVRVRLAGNFLIRSRHHLVDRDIPALLVDCRSDFQEACMDEYQASEDRVRDIEALVRRTRALLPAVSQIWIVSTSRGALTSAAAVSFGERTFTGAIHTAGMIDRARELGLDFRGAMPQFIIHHADDPCYVTSFASARTLAREQSITLITARGGNGFRGRLCDAYTQHGFNGIEPAVMGRVREVIRGTDRTNRSVP